MIIIQISIIKNSVLYVLYYYDRDLFVSAFCENTNRPEMKCNGQCKLVKMKKEQNEETTAGTLKKLQTEMVYLYSGESYYMDCNNLSVEEIGRKIPYYNILYSFQYTLQLVKPPDFFARQLEKTEF
jgi:hypothetical protein